MERCGSRTSSRTPTRENRGPPLEPYLALEKVFEVNIQPILTHLSTNDHVLAESPLQTPSTYPDLQSSSKDPKTAILYAYGIRPDHRDNPGHAEFFFSKTLPTFAAVAIVKRDHEDPLAEPTTVAAEGNAEVKRRIIRDSEVLLEAVVRVEKVILLPSFDPDNPDSSLDRAATAMLNAGVAS